MDRPHQIFYRSLEFDGCYRLGDQFCCLRTDDVHTQDFAIVGIGDDLDEAFVLTDDGSARVCCEGEFSDLDVVAGLFCFHFSQTDAADFRMAVGCVGDVLRIDRLALFPRNFGNSNNAFHCTDVCQLRRSEDDVADGVHSGLGSLHPAIGFDETAIGLDFCPLQTEVLGAGFASDGNQDFLGLDFLRFAIDAKNYVHACLALLDLVDLRAGVESDAALTIDACQFLGNFLVFDGNKPRQHFDERDFRAEGTEDRGELDANGSSADYDQGLRDFLQRQDLNVGQDILASLEAGKHAGFRSTAENHVFRLYLTGFAVGGDVDGQHAILRGTRQLAIAAYGLYFVLLHQKLETLGMLGHDLRFAFLDGWPVQLAGVYAFDAEFLGVFQVVPKFGIEQQGFGRYATHMQA